MTEEQSTDVTDVEDQNTDEPATDDASEKSVVAEPKRRSGLLARGLRVLRRRLFPTLVVALLVASAGLTAWLYVFQFRADQQTGQAAADTVVQAATDGTVAMLSYAPETLESDFAAAKSHLTGDFLSYYNDFTTEVVTPAATEKKVKTTAEVVQAGVSELRPDSAVVLVFINQTTTSADRPEPAIAASSVKVTLQEIDGRWLISSFDPA